MPNHVETTLGHLLQAIDALRRLGARPLPVKTAYHLTKLRRLIDAELSIYEERRQALVKELGTRRDATGEELLRGAPRDIYDVSSDRMPEFGARHKELLDLEVTIPWGPFDLRWLGERSEVTSDDLYALRLGDEGALVIAEDAPDEAVTTRRKIQARKSI